MSLTPAQADSPIAGESGRVDACPSPATGPAADIPSCEYLVFITHGRKLAVPITDVREIRGWSAPTPLPHAPDFLVGVVNLRGRVLPVVDLARRLGLAPTPHAERNVFIVIEVEDRALGLLVEAVADIHASVGEEHQPVPQNTQGAGDTCIQSLLLAGDEMIQILDPTAVWTAAQAEHLVPA